MVDKIVTAMGMAGGNAPTSVLSEITPAPPTGPEHDLAVSPFSIGGAASPNSKTTKSFVVKGPLTANVHVYGGGGSGPVPNSGAASGGHGGKVLGTYTFQPGITYHMTAAGSGKAAPSGAHGSGGGGSSAVWQEPEAAGQEIFVAGGGGGGGGGTAGVNGTGALSGAPSPWPSLRGERGGAVTPTTGGRAGVGRRTGDPGGDAPRGEGGHGTDIGIPAPGGNGGGSDYSIGGNGGVAPGDGGGGGGGGGYAGGGGGNNDSGGSAGAGGNGYYHPEVLNGFGAESGPTPLGGQGVFSGDPATSGQRTYAGSVIFKLET